PPPSKSRADRDAAARVRSGQAAAADVGDYPVIDPWYRRIGPALRGLGQKAALLAGLRLGWCMALATLGAVLLHRASHSYWLPLTVAVVVRPEYGSVFVRTVNRIAGTILGSLLATVVLLFVDTGWPIALVASLAAGFAVL